MFSRRKLTAEAEGVEIRREEKSRGEKAGVWREGLGEKLVLY